MMSVYFSVHGMVVAGFAGGYGRERGEVRDGPGMTPIFKALEEARAAAGSVVKLFWLRFSSHFRVPLEILLERFLLT